MKVEHCEKCGKQLPECTICQKRDMFDKKPKPDHNWHYNFDRKMEMKEDGESTTHLYCAQCWFDLDWLLKQRGFLRAKSL